MHRVPGPSGAYTIPGEKLTCFAPSVLSWSRALRRKRVSDGARRIWRADEPWLGCGMQSAVSLCPRPSAAKNSRKRGGTLPFAGGGGRSTWALVHNSHSTVRCSARTSACSLSLPPHFFCFRCEALLVLYLRRVAPFAARRHCSTKIYRALALLRPTLKSPRRRINGVGTRRPRHIMLCTTDMQ